MPQLIPFFVPEGLSGGVPIENIGVVGSLQGSSGTKKPDN